MHKILKVWQLPKFILLLILLSGCGFQMRGAISLPEHLKTLIVLPNQPYDPFQRTLRQSLKLNGIQVLVPEDKVANAAKLTIVSQEFSERVTTYGRDGQANQALMKFKVIYQFTNSQGTVIIDNQSAEVERELITNPDALLITNNERERLKADLTVEAALQLIRQLSVLP